MPGLQRAVGKLLARTHRVSAENVSYTQRHRAVPGSLRPRRVRQVVATAMSTKFDVTLRCGHYEIMHG